MGDMSGLHSESLSEAARLAAELFEDTFPAFSSSKETPYIRPTQQADALSNLDLAALHRSSSDPNFPPSGSSLYKERSNGSLQRDRSNGSLSSSFADDFEMDNLKRKRDDEAWERRVSRKLNDERNSIRERHQRVDSMNKDLFRLFNDLQGLASDFAVDCPSPEIVVVGMQSDGKSSFIEGLLGFQFNIVDTNIGTRRPLILQMLNDPTRDAPFCRFRKETLTADGEDPFEDRDVPVSYLSEEIIRRTEALVGTNKNRVSAQPIILRVEYKNCANLTIIDTPGFRLGGDERLLRDIESMVMELIKPLNRIIVCLEQSTVEWANSLSRPLVRRIDPQFSRSVLVNTKFDNRVKELRDAESANKYLAGENIPGDKIPFFISMPIRRNLDARRYKEEMDECYLSDYKELLKIRFDEEKYRGNIGFFKLKDHLEALLHQRYKENLIPTLQTLEDVCSKTFLELEAVKKELRETDLESQKSKVNNFLGSFVLYIERFLEGTVMGNPDKFGQTLQEEKSASNSGDWPMTKFVVSEHYQIQNSEFRLYGGAQYERLLNEFEFVSHSTEFPSTSINEVASALGTSKSHNVPLFEAAASDIVQAKAKQALLPLISILLNRCKFIMNNLFDITISTISSNEAHTFGILGSYDSFIKQLRQCYSDFIDETKDKCEAKALDDFAAFTKIMDWDLMGGLSELTDYDYLACTPEDTKKRVDAIMGGNRSQMLSRQSSGKSRIVDQEIYQRVLMMSGRLFAGVRYFFTKYIRAKMNAFFLDPMFQQLGRKLNDYFRKMTDAQYEEMFNMGLAQLKQKAVTLEAQLQKFTKQRDQFKQVVAGFKKLSADSLAATSHK